MTTLAFSDRELKKRILTRVYWVWFARRVLPVLAVEFGLLGVVLVEVFTHISARAILENALRASANLRAFVMFFVNNFFVKSVQSRLLLILWLGFLGYAFRDLRVLIQRLRTFYAEAMGRVAAPIRERV